MDKPKILDLESEARIRSNSAGRIQRKAGFKDKVRSGHYGDLRLLGMSAGLVLLIILTSFFRPDEEPMATTNAPIQESAVAAPPVFATTAEEPNTAESASDESAHDDGMDLDSALAADPAERTQEQQEQLIREMAENIPKGETLIW